ncbi:hypothetical protein AMTRI_Chr11g94060 [Amborella trichopoda]
MTILMVWFPIVHRIVAYSLVDIYVRQIVMYIDMNGKGGYFVLCRTW